MGTRVGVGDKVPVAGRVGVGTEELGLAAQPTRVNGGIRKPATNPNLDMWCSCRSWPPPSTALAPGPVWAPRSTVWAA